jgi:ADP-ribose pyrophosphatase
VTGFRHLGERVVHEGYIWKVVVADYAGPDGAAFQRDVVRSPGAVGVVPLLRTHGADSGDAPAGPLDGWSVVLVRQFRAAIGAEVVEIPAGMRDVAGEPPADTARRELIEEVGYDADELHPLTAFHSSVGMTDSTTHVFAAVGLRHVGDDRKGPEEAAMTTLVVPLGEAIDQVASGAITDAKTVIGLLLTERWLVGRSPRPR